MVMELSEIYPRSARHTNILRKTSEEVVGAILAGEKEISIIFPQWNWRWSIILPLKDVLYHSGLKITSVTRHCVSVGDATIYFYHRRHEAVVDSSPHIRGRNGMVIDLREYGA